jgi:hypothetical protein
MLVCACVCAFCYHCGEAGDPHIRVCVCVHVCACAQAVVGYDHFGADTCPIFDRAEVERMNAHYNGRQVCLCVCRGGV